MTGDGTGLDAFAHLVRPGTAGWGGPALLLLHGTGGDEADLLPLASAVALGAPVLSARGPVLEGGATRRWFRRFAEGVFDLDDLRRRAGDLAAWTAAARVAHADALGGGRPLVALGYSNGANIAAAWLLLGHPGLDGAVLLRAQRTLAAPAPGVDHGGRVPVLVASGARDPVVPLAEAEALRDALAAAGASVRHAVLPGAGHGLAEADLDLARDFLAGFGGA